MEVSDNIVASCCDELVKFSLQLVVLLLTEFHLEPATSGCGIFSQVNYVVCKTISRRQRDILLKVGADRVILPEREAGGRLAEELMNPGLMERFDLGPGYCIAEIELPQRYTNQSLIQSNLRQKYGINVLVVKRDTQLHTSPRADFILLDEDILVVLGANEKIEAFSQLNGS